MAVIWHHEEDIGVRAARCLAETLRTHAEEGTPVLLLLSGGSWFSIIDPVRVPEGCDLTIGMLDERFSEDGSFNNFAQLSETHFFKALPERVALLDSRVHTGETRAAHASRFEQGISDWCDAHPEGIIVVTMGLGVDGHTAGVLPGVYDEQTFTELFLETDVWVRDYSVPPEVNEHTQRVTVTLAFLREHVDHAILFARGKAQQVAALKARERRVHEVPGLIVHEMQLVDIFAEGA